MTNYKTIKECLKDYPFIKEVGLSKRQKKYLLSNDIKTIDKTYNINCDNCTSCINCINCKNCNDCINCTNCEDCDYCNYCNYCTNCKNCTNCENCENLKKQNGNNNL